MARKVHGVIPRFIAPKEPKLKWVKKANQFCITYFEDDRLGNPVQKQLWSPTKEEAENSFNKLQSEL